MSLINRLKFNQTVDGIDFKLHLDNFFAVSKCGKVIGRKGNILKPRSQGNYLIVSYFCDIDRKPKNSYIHRLVAEVYIPNPNKLETVNHKNGDKLDNRLENLEWCSHSDNINHAIDLGLMWNLPTKGQQGFRSRNE